MPARKRRGKSPTPRANAQRKSKKQHQDDETVTMFLMSRKDQPAEHDGRATSSLLTAAPTAFLRDLFLPAGFPDSVAPEYATFQAYDTLQGLCSYLRGVLSTAAILEGLGVGSAAASALAATQQTVVRDACGMLGSLLFAWRCAGAFDRDAKRWRLFADVSNDVGLTLDLLAPLAGTAVAARFGDVDDAPAVLGLPAGKFAFLAVVCLGTVCKAWCGVAAGVRRDASRAPAGVSSVCALAAAAAVAASAAVGTAAAASAGGTAASPAWHVGGVCGCAAPTTAAGGDADAAVATVVAAAAAAAVAATAPYGCRGGARRPRARTCSGAAAPAAGRTAGLQPTATSGVADGAPAPAATGVACTGAGDGALGVAAGDAAAAGDAVGGAGRPSKGGGAAVGGSTDRKVVGLSLRSATACGGGPAAAARTPPVSSSSSASAARKGWWRRRGHCRRWSGRLVSSPPRKALKGGDMLGGKATSCWTMSWMSE